MLHRNIMASPVGLDIIQLSVESLTTFPSLIPSWASKPHSRNVTVVTHHDSSALITF